MRRRDVIRSAACGVVLVAAPACGDGMGPERAGDGLTETLQSAHYVYRWAADDAAMVDTVWQEDWHDWITAELQLSVPGRIEFRKYRDRDHLRRMTGRKTNGWAQPDRDLFHTIWDRDNHEATHVMVVNEIGHAPPFLNEGIAVAHHGDPIYGRFDRHIWNGRSIHEVAREHLLAGSVPPLEDMLHRIDWSRLDSQMTYPVSGSFVRWLVDRDGIGPLKRWISETGETVGAEAVRATFRESYGEDLDDVWATWTAWVTASPSS